MQQCSLENRQFLLKFVLDFSFLHQYWHWFEMYPTAPRLIIQIVHQKVSFFPNQALASKMAFFWTAYLRLRFFLQSFSQGYSYLARRYIHLSGSLNLPHLKAHLSLWGSFCYRSVIGPICWILYPWRSYFFSWTMHFKQSALRTIWQMVSSSMPPIL